MYNEVNKQMDEAQQGMFRLNKIMAMLEELTKQQKTLEKNVEEMKDILDKETIDVEKLENKSLAHLFHSVLGNLEERMVKEQQEALAAKLKYDQAVSDLEQVNNQITQLSTERGQYTECERNYNNLYTRKKELLMASNSETANRLLALSEQLKVTNNNLNELREAIEAGKRVTSHIDNALNSLDSAEGWGIWDMFGGGLITDMVKHSHIDDAKGESDKIQMCLLKFRTELADVRINNDIHFETEGFAKFSDFFFDGLIADWCMQSRIQDSQASVEHVKNQVQQVLIKLNSMESREANHIEQIEKEISELIAKA